ncbi:MAG: OsmC family peroxiredoxin [Anaerolineaceae bacterium]|nr:MAG: OsmC family peroxiredoxin [Anaerolineaceae bacterium]
MLDEGVIVTLTDGFHTTAQSRQHTWHADLTDDKGGTDQAPTPEELVMGTLGSCMLQTAKLYAERKGWQIDRMSVQLSYERFSSGDYEGYDGDASFVHEIREYITVEGPLDPRQKERVIEIMGKCPIRRLIQNPAFFKKVETPITGD